MKSKHELEKLADDALRSIEGIEQVKANDILYGKIMNRMQARQTAERRDFSHLMLKLSLVLTLFVGINGLSFYLLHKRSQSNGAKQVSGQAAFVREYSLQNNSYGY